MIFAMGALAPGTAAATESDRAMWVWDHPESGIVEYAAAKGVTAMYVHAPPGFSSDASHTLFLSDAHAAGIEVYAMAGDPTWAKKPAPLYAWVSEVVDHGGFDGLVVDIEPYLLADWSHDRQRSRLLGKYLKALGGAADRSGSLPFLAAVPFWFDDPTLDTKDGSVIGQVLDRVDGIVVMAYRDHALGADGIIEHAGTEVDLATARGKSVVVGVETGRTGLDKTSFAEEGEAAMNSELEQVRVAFAGSAGFAGVSIHHYSAWVDLTP